MLDDLVALPGRIDNMFDVQNPFPDPSLPELVFVPGFMGVHLAGPDGRRLWLDPAALAVGRISAKIGLDEAGAALGPEGVELHPDGAFHALFSPAVFRWIAAGYAVHPFPFDFRKSLLAAAQSLRAFMDGLAAGKPGKRFVLVGHSAGALVACLYAYCDPAWKSRIAQSILLGAPFGGTFDAVEAVTGTYWLLPRLVELSRHDDRVGFQRAFATWPGLCGMLPDPDCFPEVEKLFTASGWDPDLRPAQTVLNEARGLKKLFRQSPLFEQPTLCVNTTGYRTVDSLAPGTVGAGPRTARGDGTVAGRAALIAGVPAVGVDLPHTLLILDPKAIQAVADVAAGRPCALTPIGPADYEGRFDAMEPEAQPIELLQHFGRSVLSAFEPGALAMERVARVFSPV